MRELFERSARLARRWRMLAGRYCEPSYSQEGEDRILDRLFEREGTGFYVDVGAFHPQRYSNTYLFYLRGWSGINIEPDPAAAPLFARIRPRDTHVQAGISDEPGELAYYRYDEPALNTFDAELVARRASGSAYRVIETAKVPVVTLAGVLSSRLPAGQSISFLSVDAEGYDLRVLRSNDWRRFRPRFVLAESVGASLAGLDDDPSRRFLGGVGYEPFAKAVHSVIYRDLRARPGPA